MQRPIRRKDRSASQENAWRVLQEAEYGVLSTASPEGQPYGVPLNYCVMQGAIYFHCALDGHKLDNIAANNRVSFCVVGKAQVLPDKFSTAYESAVVFGLASEVFGAEKQAALEALVDRYSPGLRAEGSRFITKFWGQTRVFKVSVDAISGKARPAE